MQTSYFKGRKVLCPRCMKYGFLSKRWIASTYCPKYFTSLLATTELWRQKMEESSNDKYTERMFDSFNRRMKGEKYRSETREHPIYGIEESEKKKWYHVMYNRHWQYYIGHYDHNKYQEQMKRYKEGKRKSRPNGRRECKLKKDKDYEIIYQGGKRFIHIDFFRDWDEWNQI